MDERLAAKHPIPARMHPITAQIPRTNTPRMTPKSVSQIGQVINRTIAMTIFLELLYRSALFAFSMAAFRFASERDIFLSTLDVVELMDLISTFVLLRFASSSSAFFLSSSVSSRKIELRIAEAFDDPPAAFGADVEDICC